MDTTRQRRDRRRHFSAAFKRQVVEETLDGRESVSVVARRHDLNTNLLFTWRRRYQQGLLGEAREETALVPVHVSPASSEAAPSGPLAEGELELQLVSGHRLRVRGHVDPGVLRAALEVLCR